jgi:hypothetical protein
MKDHFEINTGEIFPGGCGARRGIFIYKTTTSFVVTRHKGQQVSVVVDRK